MHQLICSINADIKVTDRRQWKPDRELPHVPIEAALLLLPPVQYSRNVRGINNAVATKVEASAQVGESIPESIRASTPIGGKLTF